MSESPPVSFGRLLRSLRTAAGLTQEELAEAARMSYRSVSDLERGVSRSPRRDTARLLADGLGLSGDDRARFEAAARGRPPSTGNVVPGPLPGGIAAATHTLPRDIASFTGREPEIRSVLAAVTGGVADICAISGMAGTGKTALAVHAAHRLADGFPGGQVFLQLHGHTPGHQPVDPADALASLLQASGIPAQHIPDGLEARAGLWRDHLVGRRLLLVLDNAANSGQVVSLLPGDGESRVLITSRRHLGDLPGAVTPVPLGVLTPTQAAAMFTRLAPRVGSSPDTVAEVVELAGFLPLAISLLARLFARHQSWTLADLAAETRSSLLTLTAEHESVAAAFEVSYRHLDFTQQRMFCLLGLHPGTTTEAYAAAALAGSSFDEAAGMLDSLHGEGLLTEISHRRYSMHDLLRRYARDRAAGLPDSEEAVERLLGYYQHTAARADALLTRHTQPRPPPAAPAGLLAAAPDLRDQDQALAWARAERASLLACLDEATRTGQHAQVIALTGGIAGLLRRDGPWADAITRHRAAARAASHLGDRLGQANALTHLGFVQWRMGAFPGAAQALEQALEIYRGLGDRLGQANALVYLGTTLQSTGDFPRGAQTLEQALEIYRGLGDRLGQANALAYFGRRWMTGDCPGGAQALGQALETYHDLGDRLGEGTALLFLGVARRRTGDYPAAAEALDQALRIFRDIGLRSGESSALIERGTLDTMRGGFTQAEECHLQALELARAMFCPWDEARALAGLGRCAMARGHASQAEFLLRQALEIFQQIGAAEAPGVLAELDALTSQALQSEP